MSPNLFRLLPFQVANPAAESVFITTTTPSVGLNPPVTTISDPTTTAETELDFVPKPMHPMAARLAEDVAVAHVPKGSYPAGSKIFSVVPPDQVKSYIKGLLRTELMRRAADDPSTTLYQILEQLAQRPLTTYVTGSDPAERLNFTSWMGTFSLRPGLYTDDAMHDLYMLHEMGHAVTFDYDPNVDHATWAHKLMENEKETTYFGEALIYFEIPGLRTLLNIPNIWVDRFLDERVRLHPILSNHEFFTSDRAAFAKAMWDKFREMDTRPFGEMDPIEARNALYTRTNSLFHEVWKNDYREVEGHMAEYQKMAKTDPQAATAFHVAWLDRHASGGFLFADLARRYYDESKQFYAIESHPLPQTPNFTPQVLSTLATSSENLLTAKDAGKITMTGLVEPTIALLALGVTATVYSLPFAESAAIWREFKHPASFDDLYGLPYERRQDPVHVDFINAYKTWAAPYVTGLDGFAHSYCSNGSSESIKDALGDFRAKNPNLTLHVFNGEYEGAISYAKAHGIPVVMHERTESGVAKLLASKKPGDLFYLSQPSALDGNVWAGYDDFIKATADSGIKLMVDLCYVGLVPKDYHIDVSAPHIAATFFSLSKSFGVYYQRIGGSFFREPNNLLWANLWFKNIESLRVGSELMRRFPAGELPRRYMAWQQAAITAINQETGLGLVPSDVILLAHRFGAEEFIRAQGNKYTVLLRNGVVRANLTARLDAMLRVAGQGTSEHPTPPLA